MGPQTHLVLPLGHQTPRYSGSLALLTHLGHMAHPPLTPGSSGSSGSSAPLAALASTLAPLAHLTHLTHLTPTLAALAHMAPILAALAPLAPLGGEILSPGHGYRLRNVDSNAARADDTLTFCVQVELGILSGLRQCGSIVAIADPEWKMLQLCLG